MPQNHEPQNAQDPAQAEEIIRNADREARKAVAQANEQVARGMKTLQRDLARIKEEIDRNQARAFRQYHQEVQKANLRFKDALDPQ